MFFSYEVEEESLEVLRPEDVVLGLVFRQDNTNATILAAFDRQSLDTELGYNLFFEVVAIGILVWDFEHKYLLLIPFLFPRVIHYEVLWYKELIDFARKY